MSVPDNVDRDRRKTGDGRVGLDQATVTRTLPAFSEWQKAAGAIYQFDNIVLKGLNP